MTNESELHRGYKYSVTYSGKRGHESGIIMLGLPGTKKRDRLPPPQSWARIRVEGESYWGKFVKIALNVVKKEPTESMATENVLDSMLLSWFGRDGILPGGKVCYVAIDPVVGMPDEFALEPL